MPYQIIGAVRFYERMEVRDLLAYCKLLVNPSDDISLKRVINVPARGIGKTTYEALSAVARARGVSMLEAMRQAPQELGVAQRKRIHEFISLADGLRSRIEESDAPTMVQAVIDKTSYKEHLRRGYPDADARIENVDELIAAAAVYAESHEDGSLAAFLEEIALVADIDSLDRSKGQITLMTLHNAKGLEFDCVFIAGLEDGLVPHYNSLDTIEELEEERRLFYVGMTRARKRLFLSYAKMRRRMGMIEGGTPSRFLYELPPECLDGQIEDQPAISLVGEDDLLLPPAGRAGWRRARKELDEYSQEAVSFTVGGQILHDDFGRGIVRKIEGSGENMRVTVLFDSGGERKFLARYAPMRPLS